MQDLEYIFNPRSIAVVGVSENPLNYTRIAFLDSLKEFGYQGEIYPINPKVSEISGLKAYASILDVPGPVDHVICGIRASLTPQL
jgi:Acyl-CoA synthetase (NDP forming)